MRRLTKSQAEVVLAVMLEQARSLEAKFAEIHNLSWRGIGTDGIRATDDPYPEWFDEAIRRFYETPDGRQYFWSRWLISHCEVAHTKLRLTRLSGYTYSCDEIGDLAECYRYGTSVYEAFVSAIASKAQQMLQSAA